MARRPAQQLELDLARGRDADAAIGRAAVSQPVVKREHEATLVSQDEGARVAGERRSAATELLETPGALLTRSHLRQLGLERRAVDAVFRALPVVAFPGYSRPMVRVHDAQAVAAFVADLHADGLKKQTIRKTVSVLAMVLDHARVQPNPARDRLTVKPPREERRQLQPPTAEHVEAVVHLMDSRYRLPLLTLDATGMRVGELEPLTR
jgi:hypothetical protein